MIDMVVVLLAAVGAALILSALAFVTALIGGLVNAMIVLFAGPIIDAKLGGRSPAGVG